MDITVVSRWNCAYLSVDSDAIVMTVARLEIHLRGLRKGCGIQQETQEEDYN